MSNNDWANILVYRPDIDILLPPNDEHLSVSNKIERRAFVNLQHQGHTCTYHKQAPFYSGFNNI